MGVPDPLVQYFQPSVGPIEALAHLYLELTQFLVKREKPLIGPCI